MGWSKKQKIYMGGILFFIGLICIQYAWIDSYPVYFSSIETPTFFQINAWLWPGVILCLYGLVFIGYHIKSKKILILFSSIIPLILYSYKSFFSYVPSSDAGNVRAMFEIVHFLGLDSTVEPYFQYPIYFLNNNIAYTITGLEINSLALIFFYLYGSLISVFLFLYLSKYKQEYHLAYLSLFFFFIGVYLFFNYQWVPQTLALIFFILLLFLYDKEGISYKIIMIIFFTVLVFTHAFIPVMFLIFFGLHTLRQRNQFFLFVLFCWIYTLVLFYHTTAYLPDIINVFRDSVFGVGEYRVLVTRSLKEPIGILSQTISLVNRIIVPLIWLVVSIGFFMMFIKKKLRIDTILLSITGGIYLIAGFFFTILGTRALQIVFISLSSGIEYFMDHWKKPFIVFLVFILLFSVFLPIRKSYDNYFFQLDEERSASNFLSFNINTSTVNHIGASQISGDYVLKKMIYFHHTNRDFPYPFIYRPETSEFYTIFNKTMRSDSYLVFNPNMGKHISAFGFQYDLIQDTILKNLQNNKFYQAGETYLIKDP